MKALTDIWSSITGNFNTRAKDPVIGSFVIAWTLCNWDKLAILFFGEKKIEERIVSMTDKMAIIETPNLLYQDLDLIALPIALTVTYLFALPRISLWVNRKQKDAIIAPIADQVGAKSTTMLMCEANTNLILAPLFR